MRIAVIILTIIVVVSMLICGCVFDNPHEIYAKSAIVVDVNYDTDLVTVEDFGGFLWQFFGCEDWEAGDICAMVMDNSGTPDTIFDDVVMNTNYCGWVY